MGLAGVESALFGTCCLLSFAGCGWYSGLRAHHSSYTRHRSAYFSRLCPHLGLCLFLFLLSLSHSGSAPSLGFLLVSLVCMLQLGTTKREGGKNKTMPPKVPLFSYLPLSRKSSCVAQVLGRRKACKRWRLARPLLTPNLCIFQPPLQT